MKHLPHIIVTRHGRCVHNVPGNDHLWLDYSNDEVMGLTLEGIKETAVKAHHLATILRSDRNVYLMGSQSFRAQQTASLLASELRNKYGFPGAVWVKKTPLSVMNELPYPTLVSPFNPAFDFQQFKSSPKYDGGHGSFAGRFNSLRQAVHHGTFQMSVLEALPSIPDPTDQIVIVSHHYVTSALIGALCYEASKAGEQHHEEPEEDFYRSKFVEASHKFYLQHDDLFYLSPIIRSDKYGPPDRDHHLAALWSYTAGRLRKEIMDPTGLSLHPMFSNDDSSKQPNPA
jgi:hypothetical protein